MSLLEANTLGLPVLARTIPAVHGGPARWIAASPAAIATMAAQLLDSPRLISENVAEWREWLSDNTYETQRSRLLAAYAGSAV